MRLPGKARLLPGFLELLVEFFDRAGELMNLPCLVRYLCFEPGDASRQLLDLLEMRRRRRADEAVYALIFDLDHLVELADGRRDRRDSFFVDDSDLGLA